MSAQKKKLTMYTVKVRNFAPIPGFGPVKPPKPRLVGVWGAPENAHLGVGNSPDEETIVVKDAKILALNSLFAQKRVKRKELCRFYQAMSKSYGKGGGVDMSLELAGTNAKTEALRGVIGTMRADTSHGKVLSEAMSGHPETFPPEAIAMISAANDAGRVPDAFAELAKQLENSGRLMRKVLKAFAYPVIMIAVAIAMLIGVLFFVIPKMEATFASMGGDLPLITAIFAKCSKVLIACPFLAATPYLAPVALWFWWHKIRSKEFVQRAIVSLPAIGPLVCSVILARCMRTLAMLINAGITQDKCYEMVAHVAGNITFREYFLSIKHRILGGAAPETAFLMERHRIGEIGRDLANQVRIGAPSGSTDELLLDVAKDLEEETDLKLDLAIQAMQPLMLAVIGALVLTIIVAIYFPSFVMLIKVMKNSVGGH